MKIGIMGGTFDPIHNGHLMLGRYACRDYRLDQVWFMPNGNPPHKDKESIEADADERAGMVRLAIADEPRFRLEDYEIRQRGVSCSYRTMEHFKETHPGDTFYFIIGADSLFAIETWVQFERIFPTCVLLAACRDDINSAEAMEERIAYLKERYGADIRLLKTPLLDVSSHELRSMLRQGADVSGRLPGAVEAYIKENNLYAGGDLDE